MLQKINFCDDDILYILGDIVDRGDCPMEIILDIAKRTNVKCLLGNHDYTARELLKHIYNDNAPFYDDEFKKEFDAWLNCGGQTTFDGFNKLSEYEQKTVLHFLNSLAINEKLNIKGRTFLLSHTVPQKSIMRNINDISFYDFILGTPDYDRKYFNDVILVTGHTPTCYISIDCTGKILSCNNHIAIDCGVFLGQNLGCICLDTLEEFYV